MTGGPHNESCGELGRRFQGESTPSSESNEDQHVSRGVTPQRSEELELVRPAGHASARIIGRAAAGRQSASRDPHRPRERSPPCVRAVSPFHSRAKMKPGRIGLFNNRSGND